MLKRGADFREYHLLVAGVSIVENGARKGNVGSCIIPGMGPGFWEGAGRWRDLA
jgi:hypothetical protein